MPNKVGILNFFYTKGNYGAVLQAAALEAFLKNNGYESEHIRLIPIGFFPKKKLFKYLRRKLKKSVRNSFLILRGKELPLETQDENPEVFDLFTQQWITTSKALYHSTEDLSKASLDYNTYIVGSDQIWRWAYTQTMIRSFFLTFASSESRKIAYAASFGLNYWENDDPDFTNEIKRAISRFDAVSVREKSGVDICKNVFDIKAQHVLDPTLLIGRDFFERIIKDAPTECSAPDLVYYKLDLDQNFNELISTISDEYSFSEENILYTEQLNNNILKKFYIDVPSWLYKIKNSSLVITDSFHCTCFAILFERQFIYYPNDSRGISRLESLLEELDLLDRIYSGNKSYKYLIENKINYSAVNLQLDKQKVLSKDFLLTALSN